MNTSLLGVHSIYPKYVIPWVKEMSAVGRPFPVVLAVDNGGVALDVKAFSSTTLTLARFLPDVSLQELSENPVPALDPLADAIIQKYFDRTNADERAAINYYVVHNEADPPNVWGYTNLGLLMVKCMDRAEAQGIKLGLFGFNYGTPEWAEMQALVATGVFERAWLGGHVIVAHEGHWAGPMLVVGSIPGAPTVPGAGPGNFRYRYLYSLIPEGRRPRLVVGELVAGYTPAFTPEQVRDRFIQYDVEMHRDHTRYNIPSIAWLPFTADPTKEWIAQDYRDVYPLLLQYAKAVVFEEEPEPPPAGPAWVIVRENAYHKWNLRTGPGTANAQGAAVAAGSRLPVLASAPGLTGGISETWYQVLPAGFAPGNAPALWIAGSAVEPE